MKRIKRDKPRICGYCIFYLGDSESGFCELNEEKPEAKIL